LKKQQGNLFKYHSSTREIVYISLLVALNIVLTRIASIRVPMAGVEMVRIGFGALPVVFAGIYMGPRAGGIVGALGDAIGFWINPMGPYMPHFTLTAALTGIIPPLVLKCFNTKGDYTFWQLLVGMAVGQTITAVLLVPYFMQSHYGVPMIVTMIPRIQTQVIQVPLYAFLVKSIARRVSIAFG